MANYLKPERLNRIETLLLEGHPAREIARMTGSTANTINRVRIKIEDKLGEGLRCKCGEPVGHHGWCMERLLRSPGMLAHHKREWGWYPGKPKKRYVPQEPAALPFIPHEQETEIQLLTKTPNFLSFDVSAGRGAGTRHEDIDGVCFQQDDLYFNQTPADILMDKEGWEEEQREAWPLIIRRRASDSTELTLACVAVLDALINSDSMVQIPLDSLPDSATLPS